MNSGSGDEVDSPAEHSSEFIGKIVDLPPQTDTRSKFVQQIDVTVACGFASRERTEHLETSDPETTADRSKTLEIDVQLVDGHRRSVRDRWRREPDERASARSTGMHGARCHTESPHRTPAAPLVRRAKNGIYSPGPEPQDVGTADTASDAGAVDLSRRRMGTSAAPTF